MLDKPPETEYTYPKDRRQNEPLETRQSGTCNVPFPQQVLSRKQKGALPTMNKPILHKSRKERKKHVLLLLGALALTAMLAGCEKEEEEDSSEYEMAFRESVESSEEQASQGDSESAAGKERSDGSEPGTEAPAFTYLEQLMIEDYYGDKAEYEVYAPKGSSCEDGIVFYSDHGLTYSAYVTSYVYGSSMQECLEDAMRFETDFWKEQAAEYTDVQIGEVTKNGADLYQVAQAKRKDAFDVPFDLKRICYMNEKKDGLCVQWSLELSECNEDEETNLILDELAQCYGFDAAKVKSDGGWAAANEARIQAQKAKDSPPETVLWFNATYAPNTQANASFGTNWKLVGGMNVSDYNAKFEQAALSRDWKITDAASALETVERLREKGHRETFRQCVEVLADMELLDVDENTFVDTMSELMETGEIEGNIFRYVMAYSLHKNGQDADCIAAWDLCRANQLYASFYVCGYMTYEEAMDASLENSLVLQGMYSSWEEMTASYLLGYQFWKGDPATTADSPTQQRFQCILELLEMEDGPYDLDWNANLQKSW